ncbi:MAG TPA: FAD-dependent oxidoreductase [Acetobacteraceae bacterium]
MPTPDLLIVGGGAVGVATAYELASAGASVTLVERGESLASGCSYGNTGLIRTSHASPLATPAAVRQALRWSFAQSSPFHVHPRPAVLPWLLRFISAASDRKRVAAATDALRTLSIAGLRLHAEYAHADIETGFRHNGILDVFATEKGFSDGIADSKQRAAAGQDSQVLSAGELRQSVATLGRHLVGGIHYPGDANCDPLRFVRNVGAAGQQRGVAVQTHTDVLRLERAGSRITAVYTSRGSLHPGVIVLAAGVWTPHLARQIGVFVPLEGAKGYHVDWQRTSGDPHFPVFITEARVIATPLPEVLRFGGTLELDGLNPRINPTRVEAIKRAAYETFSHTRNAAITEIWSGLRPCTPDGLPMIGWAPGFDNLIIATGHGMSGLQLSTVTGRLVKELVFHEPPSHDLQLVRPDRFTPFFGLF